MSKKKPSKKAKKSPAQARMKPWKGFCFLPHKGRVPIAFHESETFFNRTGTVPVLVTELPPSPDRRVEEVKALCEETLRWDKKHYMASKILRILNSKGPR